MNRRTKLKIQAEADALAERWRAQYAAGAGHRQYANKSAGRGSALTKAAKPLDASDPAARYAATQQAVIQKMITSTDPRERERGWALRAEVAASTETEAERQEELVAEALRRQASGQGPQNVWRWTA